MWEEKSIYAQNHIFKGFEEYNNQDAKDLIPLVHAMPASVHTALCLVELPPNILLSKFSCLRL